MLIFASNFINHKTQSVLHLIYYKDKKNPQVKIGMGSIKSDTHTEFRVGEQLTTWAYIKAFPTIVLHPPSEQYWEEMLSQLIRNKFNEWLYEFALNPQRELIVIGSAVRMMSKEPIVFKHSDGFMNNFLQIASTARSILGGSVNATRSTMKYTQGLGLFPHALDINFNEKETFKNDKNYAAEVEHFSDQNTLYLLDPRVVITSEDLGSYRAFMGSWYTYHKHHLNMISEMTDEHSERKSNILRNRQLKPIRVIYEDELSVEEKQDANAIASKIKEV